MAINRDVAGIHPEHPRHGRLFRKYVRFIVALVAGVLLISGAIELYFSYRENRAALAQIQQEKALTAAVRIEEFIRGIVGQLGWTTHPQLVGAEATLEQKRIEFYRLLRQAPAITDLGYLDAEGKEQLRISRLALDVTGGARDLGTSEPFRLARTTGIYYGPVHFRKGSEPYMTIALPVANGGVAVAEVNLKFIWDVVSAIRIGQAGLGYVVDPEGHLIAHPDIGLVLQRTDFSPLAQVQAARAATVRGGPPDTTRVARDSRGRQVLTSYAPVAPLGWFVFLEQPLEEAWAPLYASVVRSLALMLIGLLLALLVSLFLARRMVNPIRALQAGAARIGAGELDSRIAVQTDDELGMLAESFNRMAARLQESYADLERKVEERTRELSEALERQTATSEVLGVISRSTTELQPVLDTIVETAARLCHAEWAVIYKRESDGRYHLAAANEADEKFLHYMVEHPIIRERGSIAGRTALEGKVQHIPDVLADPEYTWLETQAMVGFRSMLGVPLLRGSAVIGVIVLARNAVCPFTDNEIELVTTFADQAVIAIENVRLFDEVQARTRDLTEALEQQTATSAILRVISTSPTEVQPVFEAIVRNAVALCGSLFANVFRFDGELLHFVASYNVGPSHVELLRTKYPMRPDSSQVAGRVVLTRSVVRLEDALADPNYDQRFPTAMGWRRMLGVPMLRQGEPLGVIVVGWAEAGPVPKSQEELLKQFADQAVIAIENVRLFEEVQARTRQLERLVRELETLGEVSRAVNASLDLGAVLRSIAAHAVAVAEADAGIFQAYDEENQVFRPRAAHELDPELLRIVTERPAGLGVGAIGQAGLRRRAVQIPNIDQAKDYALYDIVRRPGYRALLAVPLLREDSLVGGLVLLRKTPGPFAPATVDLVQTLANQSVLAIENAELFQEIERKGRELEAANQHKSRFLANMSHELRTPLNAVLGYAELIQDGIYGEVPEKIHGVLERIQQNGRHLLGLINAVLDLAKIEAGQLTLALGDYSLREVIFEAAAAVESLAVEKGLALDVELAPDLPSGHGDAQRIRQVLLNLLGNAIKFTETGEIKVRAVAEDGLFTVAVTDTGPGIAATEQRRVFEEFQQLDDSSTRVQGGTGLGLAIARKIVELHGGSIGLESETGRGSTFWFKLPVAVERQQEAA